jgi:lipopolysaccharide export system permease protein
MTRITRYLVSTILGFTAITGLALVAIYTFITFVSEIDETGEGGFGMLQLLLYTLMLMPAGLYTLMPIIALLGTLMGLGALAAQNEINAMRASGVTLLRLGGAALLAGAVLGAGAVLLGDWLAPLGNAAAQAFKNKSRYSVENAVSSRPVWLRDGDNILHVRALQAEDAMADLDIYTLSPQLQIEQAMHVDRAHYVGGHWELTGVRTTRFDGERTVSESVPAMRWDATLSPDVLRLFVLEANSLSTPGLMRLISYMDENGLDAQAYRLSLWRKLVAPFTVMAMMLVAVPFVLGSQRGGAGQRLLVGIMVGLVFYLVNEVTASLGQLFGLPNLASAGLPTLLLAALAVLRLKRAR